jgi:hypothetical protein
MAPWDDILDDEDIIQPVPEDSLASSDTASGEGVDDGLIHWDSLQANLI